MIESTILGAQFVSTDGRQPEALECFRPKNQRCGGSFFDSDSFDTVFSANRQFYASPGTDRPEQRWNSPLLKSEHTDFDAAAQLKSESDQP